MLTDRAITRPSSEPVGMGPIVDKQTRVKTLPSLAVGKNVLLIIYELSDTSTSLENTLLLN